MSEPSGRSERIEVVLTTSVPSHRSVVRRGRKQTGESLGNVLNTHILLCLIGAMRIKDGRRISVAFCCCTRELSRISIIDPVALERE